MNFLHSTREGWLVAAMQLLDQKFFHANGYTLPDKLSISCGFPRGSKKAIGQCWDPKVTKDGTVHMFICPTIGDGMRVLDITLHEMIHASVGLKCKHRGPFKKMAKEFGLEGKMTATFVTAGTELHAKLASIFTELGDYPHSALVSKTMGGGDEGDEDGEDKPKRKVTLISSQNPDFKLVIRRSVIEEYGMPKDPWGEPMFDPENPPEPEAEDPEHRFDAEDEAEDQE